MKRAFAVLTVAAVATIMLAGHPAQAGDGSTLGSDIWAWIDGILVDLSGDKTPVTGGVHAAPAPLLAAGIPAFVALGGVVAFGKLRRKLSRRG